MTEKERAEMQNLRKRIVSQRELLKRLQAKIEAVPAEDGDSVSDSDLVRRGDIMPAVIRALTDYFVVGEYDRFLAGEIANEIDAIPTEKQIVRCADCKHYGGNDGLCPTHSTGDPYLDWTPPPDWYCADGEKRGAE